MGLLRRIGGRSGFAVVVLVIVCFLSSPVNGQPWDGNGVEGDPYQIWDANDMQAIGADANYWDAHFELMADIDLGGYTGTSYNVIGTSIFNSFTGTFDGDSHTISNFTYDSNGVNYIGLFGYINEPNAEVKNLGLIEPNVSTGTGGNVGTLAGYLRNGAVSGCYVEGGSVSGAYGGGLVGGNGGGSISDCYSMIDVSGTVTAGGLVGSNHEGSISDCYSTGGVTGGIAVGGLVGSNSFYDDIKVQIQGCYSTGSVMGRHQIGGLVGYNESSVSDCYSMSNVSGTGGVGGLVGYSYSGSISGCYSAGSVTGEEYVGGLVGSNRGDIQGCYSTGSVSGAERVGGLVGWNYGEIQGTYSAGFVAGVTYVGGLVGNNDGVFYLKSFWDSDVNPDVNGIGNGEEPNVVGLPTVLMQTESTFTDAGWDFVGEVINGPNDIWKICNGESYPQVWYEKYGGGLGDANNPYLIYTSCQMQEIGADSNDWDAHFELMADIDLSAYTGTSFNIIGTYPDNPFSGVFDGNGHVLSNFTYESNGVDGIGLFGYVHGGPAGVPNAPNAIIQDVGLADPNIKSGGDYVGGLVGCILGGTVKDCYVQGGKVSGRFYVGGLLGGPQSSAMAVNQVITSCYSSTSVSGDDYVGGLVGTSSAAITNCSSTGSVSGDDYVGGLVGWNEYGTVSNSYATASVSGDDGVGGLVGLLFAGPVSNSYSAGGVSGNSLVGGLVGYISSGSVTASFWDVNSSGQGSSDGGTGKTTAQMQMESTFTSVGWDFVDETDNGIEDIWRLCNEGTEYPQLNWQYSLGDFGCPDGVDWFDLGVLCDEWLLEELSLDLWPDGFVDFLDWAIFADDWGVTYGMSDLEEFAEQWLKRGATVADIAPDTGDGIVNMADFAVVADNWLEGL